MFSLPRDLVVGQHFRHHCELQRTAALLQYIENSVVPNRVMRVHDVSGETHDWRFEYSPAAPAHAHPLFEVAALRLGSSGGSSNGDVKGRPTLRKELKEQSRVGGLIRKASDAQRLLKEAVVEAQWAELGNHYGTQLLNFSRPRVSFQLNPFASVGEQKKSALYINLARKCCIMFDGNAVLVCTGGLIDTDCFYGWSILSIAIQMDDC